MFVQIRYQHKFRWNCSYYIYRIGSGESHKNKKRNRNQGCQNRIFHYHQKGGFMVGLRSLVWSLCVMGFTPLLLAQGLPTPVATGPWEFKAAFSAGGGLKSIEVFETTNNEIVTLSPGGGGGFHFLLGYLYRGKILTELGLGYQESVLSKQLKNADGLFGRSILSGSVMIRYPLNPPNLLYLGGGIGLYSDGSMDVDGAEIDGGAHNIYSYKPAVGAHLKGEYARMMPNVTWLNRPVGWGIGLSYSTVKYRLKSAMSNGYAIPIDQLDSSVRNEIDNLDGSGLDILFTLFLQ